MLRTEINYISNIFISSVKSFLYFVKNIFLNLYKKKFLKSKSESLYKIGDTQYMQCNIKYCFSPPRERVNSYLKKYKISSNYFSVCEKSFLLGNFLYGFDSNLTPLIESFPHKYFFKKRI